MLVIAEEHAQPTLALLRLRPFLLFVNARRLLYILIIVAGAS